MEDVTTDDLDPIQSQNMAREYTRATTDDLNSVQSDNMARAYARADNPGFAFTIPMPLAPGVDLSKKTTIKAVESEYHRSVQPLFARVKAEFFLRMDMMPNFEMQMAMMRTSWESAVMHMREPLYECTYRVTRMLADRRCNFRGTMLKVARELIMMHYGLVLTNNPDVTAKNREVVHEAIDQSRWAHREPNVLGTPPHFYCEAVIIQEVLYRILFVEKPSLGIMFPDSLKPIPLALIAGVLLTIEHALHEWITGTFQNVAFSETAMPGGLTRGSTARYREHCKSVQNWDTTGWKYGTALPKRNQWFKDGAEHAGMIDRVAVDSRAEEAQRLLEAMEADLKTEAVALGLVEI